MVTSGGNAYYNFKVFPSLSEGLIRCSLFLLPRGESPLPCWQELRCWHQAVPIGCRDVSGTSACKAKQAGLQPHWPSQTVPGASENSSHFNLSPYWFPRQPSSGLVGRRRSSFKLQLRLSAELRMELFIITYYLSDIWGCIWDWGLILLGTVDISSHTVLAV